ncbi:uncharacterized protein LOC100210658 [Hydra vulgaris]|uniref:uncharacterized protein LOC100210658 n=1 Tax=Hydra vulgaris TaxID=6087 RepID=UPI00064183B1|nr:adducin-related protein C1289.14 [Hydra vulgaris]
MLQKLVSKYGKKLVIQTFSHARFFSNGKQVLKLSKEEILAKNWERRCELATAYRAFAKLNMNEGVCNHLTTKAPSLHCDEDIILIIPYGVYWSEVTPQCLAGIDKDNGNLIEGSDKPELTAHSIHRGIYRHRPDVNAIMHTHSEYAAALSVLDDMEIKPIHQNSCRFIGNVMYDKNYGAIAADGENDEADRLGKTIGDKDILLMGNHGTTSVGSTVALAFDLHYYFEIAAKVQIMAYQTGKPFRTLGPDVALSIYNYMRKDCHYYANAHFSGIQKALMREDPTFLRQTRVHH